MVPNLQEQLTGKCGMSNMLPHPPVYYNNVRNCMDTPRIARDANYNRIKAFTLIELSIVLVIIGLIVGGVLVGRDLIKAAQYRKIITEVESFRTAANTFKVKYDCLAGDCPNATTFLGTSSAGCPTGAGATGTCNGTGDMLFGDWSINETFLFWQHLALAGLVPGKFTGVVTPVQSYRSVPGTNVPPGAFENSGYSVSGTADGGWTRSNFFANGLDNGSAVFMFHLAYANLNGLASAMSSSEMRMLDRKYDDGLAVSGRIRAEFGNLCVTGTDPATAGYTGSSTVGCIPLFSFY